MSNATAEWAPTALASATNIKREYVRLSEVRVDPTYQRDVNEPKVSRIVGKFNPHRFEPIDVSVREDGTMWVFDGQHRCEVARKMGLQVVAANLHFGLTIEEEAALYDSQTEDTTPLDIWDHHKARLRYRHPAATAIETVVSRNGYRLSRNHDGPKAIQAVGALYAVHGWGGTSLLDEVLSITSTVWRRDEKAVGGLMLKGLAIFLLSWGSYDRNRLMDVLARYPAVLIGSEALKLKVATGSGSVSAGLIATVLRDTYNKGLGSERKLTGTPRSPRRGTAVGYVKRTRH